MTIDYDYKKTSHTLPGPVAALPFFFPDKIPKSLLDVGCGPGIWLKAALDFGIADVVGIDGISLTQQEFMASNEFFRKIDLEQPWDLHRTFDAILCLEVAEHLEQAKAKDFIKSLTRHSDTIFFSAARPGQGGQHHVNCQWPEYWQKIFNEFGYICSDSIRWKIWDLKELEPWYRQNIFVATKNLNNTNKEPRIPRVIHPEMLSSIDINQKHLVPTNNMNKKSFLHFLCEYKECSLYKALRSLYWKIKQ
jgi:SAM-dependent methyltransferase